MSDEPTLSDFGPSGAGDEAEEPTDRDTASSEAGDAEPSGENARTPKKKTGTPGDDSKAPGDNAEPVGEETEPVGDETEPVGDETGFSTYAWGDYICSHCDGETDRVWRADGEFVCPECKTW